MTNTPFDSIAEYRDVESLNWAREALARGLPEDEVLARLAYKSRDNARTPMLWDDGPNAGFTTGTPWIKVNPNHVEVNARAAVADPHSVFHHHRRLIALRHTEPVIVDGDYRLLLADDEQVWAYVRALGEQRLLVVANLSGEPAAVDLGPDATLLAGEVLIESGNEPGISQGGEAEGRLVLAPWEARALLTR